MDKDIETLVTALYVKINDEYGDIRSFGRPPKLIGHGAVAYPPPMKANAGAPELRAHLRASIGSDADDMRADREADGENWPGGSHDA